MAPTSLAIMVGMLVTVSSTASAAGCQADSSSLDTSIFVSGTCTASPNAGGGGSTEVPYFTAYKWVSACGSDGAANCLEGLDLCPAGQNYMHQYGLHNDTWIEIDRGCAEPNKTPTPTVTPALVASAFQQIPLPRLRAITQPTDKTLVNFETLFRVETQPIERAITLLGQRVDLAIRASSFRWTYGDGTSTVTDVPGRPYPAKDIVHRYQHAHVTVHQHVEVTWSARWRLGGGAWADVPGTVTTIGPDTALSILEATPALSGFGH